MHGANEVIDTVKKSSGDTERIGIEFLFYRQEPPVELLLNELIGTCRHQTRHPLFALLWLSFGKPPHFGGLTRDIASPLRAHSRRTSNASPPPTQLT